MEVNRLWLPMLDERYIIGSIKAVAKTAASGVTFLGPEQETPKGKDDWVFVRVDIHDEEGPDNSWFARAIVQFDIHSRIKRTGSTNYYGAKAVSHLLKTAFRNKDIAISNGAAVVGVARFGPCKSLPLGSMAGIINHVLSTDCMICSLV